MPILVGGAGSGKTSVARLVASLAGRALSEIALTSGTDTSDLLGSFEQLEPSRRLQASRITPQMCRWIDRTAGQAVLQASLSRCLMDAMQGNGQCLRCSAVLSALSRTRTLG
jgi:ABC-type glutathione transport system ATPase component